MNQEAHARAIVVRLVKGDANRKKEDVPKHMFLSSETALAINIP
jgi:hypothetical protein